MAKGSQSQASSTVSKGGSSAAGAGRTGPAGLGPRGSTAASSSSGLRKRRTSSSGSGGSGGGFGGNGNMLRFYTDDAPGHCASRRWEALQLQIWQCLVFAWYVRCRIFFDAKTSKCP